MQMNDARISRITVIKLPEGWGSWKHQMIQIVEELPASWQLSTGFFLGGKLPNNKNLSTELEPFRHWGWCWHDYGSLILKVLRSSQLGYGYDLGWSVKPEKAASFRVFSVQSMKSHVEILQHPAPSGCTLSICSLPFQTAGFIGSLVVKHEWAGIAGSDCSKFGSWRYPKKWQMERALCRWEYGFLT